MTSPDSRPSYCRDWVIDLGPEGGGEGGRLVAEGTPEEVAANPASHTGRFLKEVLGMKKAQKIAARTLHRRPVT